MVRRNQLILGSLTSTLSGRGERGFQSRGIIDACRPYEWMDEFPKVSGASAELRAKVTEKFGASLAGTKRS